MFGFIHSFLAKVRNSLADVVHNKLYYDMRVQELRYSALFSRESGITSALLTNTDLVVSLTTHHRRIYEVYLAIESILTGSVKPNRIVLWLSNEFKGFLLPQTLLNQQKRGLEIRYTKDIGPYTKLIPSLKAFPKACIVTIDDDILYPYDTLEMLLSCHNVRLDSICANRILNVELDSKGQPTHLRTWQELLDKKRVSTRNFFEGVGGVLYPPQCFTEEVFNKSTFSALCPTADDVWFNAMAMLAHSPIVPANHHYSKFPLLINESVQDSALWHVNNSFDGNNNEIQLVSVLRRYNLHYHE